MEHIVKTYILLLFSLLVSSIGYAQEENEYHYIFRKGNGALFCVVNVVMLGWIIKEILFSGFGKLQEISADDDFNLVLAEKAL